MSRLAIVLLVVFAALKTFGDKALPFNSKHYLELCGGSIYPNCDSSQTNAESMLRDAFNYARAANKVVVVDFGADWCSACHTLDQVLSTESGTNRPFIIVKISGETQSAENLISKYGIDLRHYPSLFTFDPWKEKAISGVPYNSYFGSMDGLQKGILSTLPSDFFQQSHSLNTVASPPVNPVPGKTISGSTQVVFLTTGADARGVPWEVASDIEFSKSSLMRLGISEDDTLTFFGSPRQDEYEAYFSNRWGQAYYTVLPRLRRSGAFTKDTVLSAESSGNYTKRLVLMSGHGSPTHVATWGGGAVDPTDMYEITKKGVKESVLVGSVCFGGIFAPSATCGFFEARPDTYAAACSDEGVTGKNDFVKTFVRNIVTTNGQITFAKAHAIATAAFTYDVPYTTIDDLSDQVFRQWRDSGDSRYLGSISPSDFENLVNRYADEPERIIAKDLITFSQNCGCHDFSLDPDFQRDQSHWQKIRIAQLARRLWVKAKSSEDPRSTFATKLAALQACENQVARDFFFKK